MNYSKHIQQCVDKTLNGLSRLSDYAFSIEGMSSNNIRTLVNYLLDTGDSRYLEIGTWKGATFYAALYCNKIKQSTVIDDFSQFGGSIQLFLKTMEGIDKQFQLIESDCFKVDLNTLKGPYNFYFFDGYHSIDHQTKALTEYYPVLDDEFIYICDDWNWDDVRNGTKAGVAACGLTVVKDWEFFTPERKNGDTTTWWNGFYVAHMRK